MDKKKKELVTEMIKGIIISSLVALGIYALIAIPLSIFIYDEDYNENTNAVPLYACMIIAYAIANSIVYIKRACSYADMDISEEFSFTNDLLAYIRGDGRYLLMIYGILAVVSEIGSLCRIDIIPTALIFCFPVQAILTDIPIIRTAAAYAVLMIMLLLLTECFRYREYKRRKEYQELQ